MEDKIIILTQDVNNLDIETHTGKSADFISIDSLCSVLDSEDKPQATKKIGF